jgi:XTP/dITP diphosphohydrolase
VFNTIVLATTNQGKRKEIESFFSEINFLTLLDFPATPPEESGMTFIENAIIKARHAADISGLPALADDSGLCVQALDEAPGVFSARFAGKAANDQQNIEKLLRLLSGQKERQAFFYCALVLMRQAKDPAPIIAEGIWHGEITTKTKGENGFGYDPVFYDPRLGKMAAELSVFEKNQVSHRGQALSCLKAKFKQLKI